MSYLVHNGSRSRTNRMLRAQQPEHGGHKQYVCGNAYRLLRGRPVSLQEADLRTHLEELREKEALGLLYVTLLDGRPFDLTTLTVQEVTPESPKPMPPLDSEANDNNYASDSPMFRGELPPPKEYTMPVEAPTAALQGNPLVQEESVEDVFSSLVGAVEESTAPTADAPVDTAVRKRRGGR